MKKDKDMSYKWSALITVSIGTFIGTLDASIVNISFPRLTEVFNTEPSVVLWVSVVYLLVSVSLMLSLGRIGDTLGRKKVYIAGLALVTVGLALCSISQNILHLILSRVLQGVGAAMTIALSTAIVTSAFPDQERGKALGIIGGVVSAGLLSGPVLGGFLLDFLGWRSIFYTRIPISIIGLIMAGILLKEQKVSSNGMKFDIWGAVTLFGSLTCLLLFFNFGGRLGFLSPPVLILVSSAVILFVLFIIAERRAAQPIVDLNLFRDRLFASANVSLVIIFLAMASLTFLMPFYLINGIGHSASKAGLLLATVSLTALVIGPLSGWLSDKIGSRVLCTVGSALVCLALFLLRGLGPESSDIDILLRLVVLGVGTGMFQSPNNSSIMGSVPRERLSTASAMLGTVRQVGMSSGIAIAGTIYTARQLFHAAQLASDNLAPTMLQRLSIVGGFQDTLLVAAIVCSIGIIASLVRGRQPPN